MRRGRWTRGSAAASVFLALFGVSDFVEVHTGAWWRPWWLLAWKGDCIFALAGIYVWWRWWERVEALERSYEKA